VWEAVDLAENLALQALQFGKTVTPAAISHRYQP